MAKAVDWLFMVSQVSMHEVKLIYYWLFYGYYKSREFFRNESIIVISIEYWKYYSL